MTTAAHSAKPADTRHLALEDAATCEPFAPASSGRVADARRVPGGRIGADRGHAPARGVRSRGMGSTELSYNALDRDDIWGRIVKPGARLPSVVLLEADLGPIHLDRLRQTGPIVLAFFPYASSETADAALADYERRLAPALAESDAHLVAVSPQIPARLVEVKRRHDLSYFVAADPRHQLIDAFNLGFHAPGADKLLGAGRSVLPFPAVVIADRTGVVRFADVRPDGAAHPDPNRILTALS
ncbi:redoxin domain-containing protein [Actinoplanes sp. TRM 88003]|uniref:Redoxin domain-containing protein n=1 Tax=Paractinoplanes aksuensis TaxID=2939490 RepID=A0ABT1DG86_9ACTN|nr:redoxin domain-containing protein [Actinoplanes aksuensis]MCO8269859.1 redoxin domain-containing protein [Actinoplanes aksuensis]